MLRRSDRPTAEPRECHVKPVSILLRSMVGTAALTAATSGQAALVARPGGMVYDTVQNITWLADWNYAKTQYDSSDGTLGYADGWMDWMTAGAWAKDLVYGGVSDWRLPTALNADGSGPCLEFFCAGSEMGYMFYNYLGGKANESVLIQAGDTEEEVGNLALFANIRPQYWAGEQPPLEESRAWVFNTLSGYQSTSFRFGGGYAVAVRNGDVAAVPEPATVALVGAALFGLAASRRRQPATSTA